MPSAERKGEMERMRTCPSVCRESLRPRESVWKVMVRGGPRMVCGGGDDDVDQGSWFEI